MKFAAGITLYYPEQEQLEKVKKYIEIFDYVIVVDNSEDKNVFSEQIENLARIEYSSENNIGLPKAFNYMIKQANENGIDFLCLLDQDSQFIVSDILKMKNLILGVENKKTIAIVAPKVVYCKTKSFIEKRDEVSKVDWVITSGSFLNLKVLINHEIKYDENYFIDRCDADLCKQVIKCGCDILEFRNVFLYQQLGEMNEKGYREHSVFRHYYMFRDRLYFNKKFYGRRKRYFLNIVQTLRHYIMILLYENEKRKKIKISFTSFRDYMDGKMGKRSIR